MLDDDLAFAKKVDALHHPGIWPVPTQTVEIIHTHLACVFLTDAHAFKMKRPIRYHDVDFTDLERRREACEQELALNRPFAGDVYQTTIALRRSSSGRLTFASSGTPVEWLVQMRRLPASRALDRMLRRQAVGRCHLERLTERLGRFYATASPIECDPSRHLSRLERLVTEDFAALRRQVDGVPETLVERIAAEQTRFFREHPELVAQRVREGRVVEGHGDLRPEHIYLLEVPVVIDRLEFDGDLRALDPLSDLAFLALECARLGAPEVGREVIERYRTIANDDADPRLLRFYWIQHACARAKLAVWHLADPGPRGISAWRAKACDYLLRACDAIAVP